MANFLFIDGKNVTADIEKFDDFDIELGLNSTTKTFTKSLSKTLVATGDTFEYLERIYFKDCDSHAAILDAVFKTDICGGITIPMKITVEGAKTFPVQRKIEFTMKSSTLDDQAHDKLSTDYIFDNGFLEKYEIPLVYFCQQPNYIQWVVMIWTMQLRLLVKTLETVVETVCELVTLGIGKCDLKISKFIFGRIDSWLAGTGRWSVGPLVREILDHQCAAAGLKFSSSILKDPGSKRYNLGLFTLDRGKRGDYKNTSQPERIRIGNENYPLITTIDLIEELKSTFPGTDYRIIDGTLYFETEEYFYDLANKSIYDIVSNCAKDVSYEYNKENLNSYGDFRYTLDGFDQEGNQVIGKYSAKLEWNDPYSPAQKGVLRIGPKLFSPIRFMFDQESEKKTGFFDFELYIDKFRNGAQSFIEGALFNNEGVVRTNDMVLSSSTLGTYKLICYEPNFKRSDARIIKHEYKKGFWLYNYPMYYDKTLKDQYGLGELISEFGVKLNPRLQKDKMIGNNAVVECDCDVLRSAAIEFQKIYLPTHYGKGVPRSIKLSIGKSKVRITFNDIKVLCS